jgi:hypothetical protein
MARLFAALLIVPALLAHHSTAEYDLKRPTSASGLVTRFEWSNPHARIFLDVAGDQGAVGRSEVEHWIIEIGGIAIILIACWEGTEIPGSFESHP